MIFCKNFKSNKTNYSRVIKSSNNSNFSCNLSYSNIPSFSKKTYIFSWIDNSAFKFYKTYFKNNEKNFSNSTRFRLFITNSHLETKRVKLPLHKITHPFYIAPYTEYTFLISFSLFIILCSTVAYFHTGFMLSNIELYTIIFIGSIIYWYNDLTFMSSNPNIYTNVVQQNLLLGIFLFIISEIMIFFGLFWAYFHSSLSPSDELGSTWPPVNLEVLEWWKWPTLSTMLLIYSGFSVNGFYYALKSLSLRNLFITGENYKIIENKKHKNNEITMFDAGIYNNFIKKDTIINEKLNKVRTANIKDIKFIISDRILYVIKIMNKSFNSIFKPFIKYSNINILMSFGYLEVRLLIIYSCLIYTIFFGFLFLICQKHEYSHATFNITDGVYSSVFYSLTGLHGMHVFAGLGLLIIALFRLFKDDFTYSTTPNVGITGTVWYWHFVDIVWIFLYIVVYIWGNSTGYTNIESHINNNFFNNYGLSYTKAEPRVF